MVSKDLRALKQLENRLKPELSRPPRLSWLVKANAAEADIIIAITDSDEVNMIACQIAHSIFKISTKLPESQILITWSEKSYLAIKIADRCLH